MQTTSEFIIETIAPIFNKKGYVGTSLSDLTKATGLTKGAFYANFSGKEELAIKSFEFNAQMIFGPLLEKMNEQASSIEKLLALTKYYRSFRSLEIKYGGCPILNVGIDAKFNNPTLYEASKMMAQTLVSGIIQIIEEGIVSGEIKSNVNAEKIAKNIYSMMEGGIFMASSQDDVEYLNNILDHIEDVIIANMKS